MQKLMKSRKLVVILEFILQFPIITSNEMVFMEQTELPSIEQKQNS